MQLHLRKAVQADLAACVPVFWDSDIYERYFKGDGRLERSLATAVERGELHLAVTEDGEIAGAMRVMPRGFCGLYPYLSLIGVKSSGVHSNGFSLVRKVFGIGADDGKNKEIVNTYYDELGATLGEALLTPTRIYVKPLLAAMEAADIKAVSHITGGGFYENIPRMLKEGLTAKIEKAKVPVLPIFELIQKAGNIPERDMFNTFNMGVGLCVAVSKETAQAALEAFRNAGEEAVLLGEVIEGDEGVVLW